MAVTKGGRALTAARPVVPATVVDASRNIISLHNHARRLFVRLNFSGRPCSDQRLAAPQNEAPGSKPIDARNQHTGHTPFPLDSSLYTTAPAIDTMTSPPFTPLRRSFSHNSTSSHRLSTASRFSNGSQDFATHMDASGGPSGMGNLADELDFADSDEEDWDYDAQAETEAGAIQDGVTEDARAEATQDGTIEEDQGARDSGVHVEQKSNTPLPHRNFSRPMSRDADSDSSNIFSFELEDAMAQISRLANPASHQNPDTISRTLVALQNLPPQQSLEAHTQRLTTSTNSLSSHIIQQTKYFASLSASLFSPFGLGAPLDFDIVDDHVLPAITQVMQDSPTPDSRPLHALSRLDRETADLIQTLAALSDSLQMGRQTTASAARHLRNTQTMVSDMRRESDLAEQAKWRIEKENWDHRLAERYCASECRDVVGGFEQVFEGLRKGLEEKIAA